MRGVTITAGSNAIAEYKFQPALPMRGVTDGIVRYPLLEPISTRTPHAGSDLG